MWGKAGLPPGVLDIISGFGPSVGWALCSHECWQGTSNDSPQ